MDPVFGQTVKGFSGDEYIFLGIKDDDDVMVRCPVSLKFFTFPRFFFSL
jgi:hypothetical protein